MLKSYFTETLILSTLYMAYLIGDTKNSATLTDTGLPVTFLSLLAQHAYHKYMNKLSYYNKANAKSMISTSCCCTGQLNVYVSMCVYQCGRLNTAGAIIEERHVKQTKQHS